MAIYGNTFDAFTIAFAALSLVLAGASTFGDFWVTFGGIGDEVSEAGLWEACLRVGKEKKCTRYARITGKKQEFNDSDSIRRNSKRVLQLYVVALY